MAGRSVVRVFSDGVRRELAGEVGVGAAAYDGALTGVLQRLDLAVLVQAVEQVAAGVGHQRLELHARPGQLALDHRQDVVDAVAGLGADHDGVGLALTEPGEDEGVGRVGLVHHHDLGHLVGADLAEDLADGRDLALGVGVAAVDDVEDQVGVGDLLQGRPERLDQLVGQVPDEADGVAHRVHAAVTGRRTTGGGVEGGERRVLDQRAGAGEAVEGAGLAGVGVAGDRDARDVVATALLALGVAGALHVGQLAAQLGDLGVDPAPVGLDLGLTGATAADAAAVRADPTTGLAGEVATPAAQALLHVVELGQLDLRLALLALRVLGEDVEDQRGAVDDLDLELVLEVAQLARGEVAIQDHGVGAGGADDLAEALDLAAADVRRRVGLVAALVDRVEDLRAGGLGEGGQLGHGVLGVLDRTVGPDPDQDDPLQPELAVLDLADVLELGAEPGHPAQGVPLGEVLLAGGQLGVVHVEVAVVGVPRLPGGVVGVVGGVDVVLEVPAGRLVQRGIEGEVFACVRHTCSRVGRPAPPREPFGSRRTAVAVLGAVSEDRFGELELVQAHRHLGAVRAGIWER